MPGSMDGLRLAAAVCDGWPPIQIVVASGKKRPQARDLPEQNVFLSKPYDILRLAETVVRLAA